MRVRHKVCPTSEMSELMLSTLTVTDSAAIRWWRDG